MNIRQRLLGLGLDALGASQVDRWLPIPNNASGFVLALHHVRPAAKTAFQPNADLSVTPQFLDLLIAQFRAEGWSFVSLADLTRITVSMPRDRRQIALTIDDAFTDTASHALPIFRRRQVPFTLFVVPGFCDRTTPIWWEVLERIIAKKYEIGVEGDDLPPALFCRTPDEKAAAFEVWAKWFRRDADDDRQRDVIAALAKANQVDPADLTDELVMTWDEIREIAEDPLCTLGAHTMTHPVLARLPEDRAVWEIAECSDRIEDETGVQPLTIAFPYGTADSAGVREALIARDYGYQASFCFRPGYVQRAGGRHLLPRILVNGRQKSHHFRTLLTPGLWAVRDTFRRGPAVPAI